MPHEIYRGHVLGPKELAELRPDQAVRLDRHEDGMRALILRNWPTLAAKLPADPV